MTKEIKTGYVEAGINAEIEKVLDAYLSIDIGSKSGYEKTPDNLRHYLRHTTHYLGLMDFFDANTLPEVYLTDESISLDDENDLESLIKAIKGKNVLVHLRVKANLVDSVKNYLEAVVERETRGDLAFLNWLYSNTDHVVELMKRMPDWSSWFLRLYEDGNGFVVYMDRMSTRPVIHYFRINEPVRKTLINMISKRIDRIVSNPQSLGEDDRYFAFPVHLRYNIEWRYPNADNAPDELKVFESTDYGDDELKMKVARMILETPEVGRYWMKRC